MKTITIDCTSIQDRRQLHEAIASALNFPEWYGHNLDALYDCLSEISLPTTLRLDSWDPHADWAQGFAETLCDAAQDNPSLSVCIQ